MIRKIYGSILAAICPGGLRLITKDHSASSG